MYLYTGVEASGFRAIIGLGDDLSVCLCWTGILFLGFCFFSGLLSYVAWASHWLYGLVNHGSYLAVWYWGSLIMKVRDWV